MPFPRKSKFSEGPAGVIMGKHRHHRFVGSAPFGKCQKKGCGLPWSSAIHKA